MSLPVCLLWTVQMLNQACFGMWSAFGDHWAGPCCGGVLPTASGCCGDVAEKSQGPLGTGFPLAGGCPDDSVVLRKWAPN